MGWHVDWRSFPGGAVFATDWRGRLYVFANDKVKDGEPQVTRFDPDLARREIFNTTFADFFGNALPRLSRNSFRRPTLMPGGQAAAPFQPSMPASATRPHSCSAAPIS